MRKAFVPVAWLLLCTAGLALSASKQPSGPDQKVMQLQVVLGRLGFSPGVIDGRMGQSTKLALRGFQEANGLDQSGDLDEATAKALAQYQSVPATVTATIAKSDVSGPFTNPIPKDAAKQAKLPCLCYRSPLEKLAERFHTTPETLVALNSPDTQLKEGVQIKVPAALPTSRDYQVKDETWKATLDGLNVDANEPQGDKIVVDKSDGSLRVYAGDKLVAQFPVTTGSEHDPLPIGTWKVTGMDYNPKFHYNPDLFWDAKATDKKATLPPGPNGPVGVIWIDLDKPHYGIHGTPEPQLIGRTESHGCIRLTNWDAARLSLMVKPGTPAIFQE